MRSRRPALRTATDLIQTAIFVAVLCLPMAWKLAGLGQHETTLAEFRAPSSLPAPGLDWGEISAFPEEFQAYLDDTFSFRSKLIRWHNLLRIFVFRTAPNDRVIVGKDGWVFPIQNGAMGVNRGVDPFEERELALWMASFRDDHRWLERRGKHFLLVLIPGSTEIYSEFLPDHMRRVAPSRLDQLRAALSADTSGIDWLDLGPAFLDAKGTAFDGELLYRKLDSHWNARGTYVAYRAILEHLAARFPALEAHPASDYRFEDAGPVPGNWGTRLYLGDIFPEIKVTATPRFPTRARPVERKTTSGVITSSQVADPLLPRVLMFHDSFGMLLVPFLAEHFRKAEFVSNYTFDVERIVAADHDLVILCMFEQSFASFVPNRLPSDSHGRLRQEFEAATDVRLALESAMDWTSLSAVGMAGLQPLEAPDLGVAIQTRNVSAGVELPKFEMPDDALPIVRLVIDSPGDAELQIHFITARCPRAARGLRAQFASRPLKQGRNEIFLRLLGYDIQDPLQLVPGGPPGRYELRSFEVRAAPPP
jgi:hypothetical protein